MNTQIVVEEGSQVAHARREALALAKRMALATDASDRLALVVTEAATNILKHAKTGRLLVAPLSNGEGPGIEVIALDRGPGIEDLTVSMRDGHSTTASPGLGLGSLSRLASNLDIYSRPGKGTVLRFEVRSGARDERKPASFGAVCVARPDETVSGDAWSLGVASGRRRVVVVDGLGHGPDAATAAQAALRIAEQHPDAEPADVLDAVHAGLRSTRGAAAAIAVVAPDRGSFAGIGNISAFVRTAQRSRSLLSHNGTLGLQVRKIQAFDFEFPPRSLLVMHSDGIATHWSLDNYPGLEAHHPAVIAATIYRDHARARDDATVAVLRNVGAAAQ
jgi:anti-sigma regulatory factor (Ser/Thr protein kinase)